MGRESLRRYGAVEFTKQEYDAVVDRGGFFEKKLAEAMAWGGLSPSDDFAIRIVLTENLPDDKRS